MCTTTDRCGSQSGQVICNRGICALVNPGNPPGSVCTTDADCGSNQVCSGGQCAGAANCPEGQILVNGQCQCACTVPESNLNSECGTCVVADIWTSGQKGEPCAAVPTTCGTCAWDDRTGGVINGNSCTTDGDCADPNNLGHPIFGGGPTPGGVCRGGWCQICICDADCERRFGPGYFCRNGEAYNPGFQAQTCDIANACVPYCFP